MKSGFTSSEFWLHLFAVVAPIVGAALVHSSNPLVSAVAAVVMSVVSQAGAVKYAANRTTLKQAAMDAAQTAAKAALPVAMEAAMAQPPAK